MKRLNRTAFLVLSLFTVLLLAGCQKKDVVKGGEGTNFPYTWQERNNGTIIVTLDGGYAPDYTWTVTNSDGNVASVETKKAEKDGKVTYLIEPQVQGETNITFSRIRELTAAEPTPDTSSEEIVFDDDGGKRPLANSTDDRDNTAEPDIDPIEVERVSGETSAATDDEVKQTENTVTENADEAYDAYRERLCPKDIVSEISMAIAVVPSDKKGKLTALVSADYGEEYAGLTRSTDRAFDYKLWCDDRGVLMVRLPFDTESWENSWTGEYDPPVNPEILKGTIVLEPEFTDGRYEIVSIRRIDAIDGDECFEIQGLGPGRATVSFASPVKNKKLILDIRIAEDGWISLISYRAE
ncbi:MAG: hypothetical protein J6Y89_00655 [Lachnospiraceae bacterium]|nr:hypothetical protein [Lachnospiraceae bacterium]